MDDKETSLTKKRAGCADCTTHNSLGGATCGRAAVALAAIFRDNLLGHAGVFFGGNAVAQKASVLLLSPLAACESPALVATGGVAGFARCGLVVKLVGTNQWGVLGKAADGVLANVVLRHIPGAFVLCVALGAGEELTHAPAAVCCHLVGTERRVFGAISAGATDTLVVIPLAASLIVAANAVVGRALGALAFDFLVERGLQARQVSEVALVASDGDQRVGHRVPRAGGVALVLALGAETK